MTWNVKKQKEIDRICKNKPDIKEALSILTTIDNLTAIEDSTANDLKLEEGVEYSIIQLNGSQISSITLSELIETLRNYLNKFKKNQKKMVKDFNRNKIALHKSPNDPSLPWSTPVFNLTFCHQEIIRHYEECNHLVDNILNLKAEITSLSQPKAKNDTTSIKIETTNDSASKIITNNVTYL